MSDIRQPLYGEAAARVRGQLATENLDGRVVTFAPAAAIVATDGAREHERQPHGTTLTLVDDEDVDMDKLAAIVNDSQRMAFSRVMDAIEAMFKASKDSGMTREALHELVDMYADAEAARR